MIDVRETGALELAYIGDAVYELYIRERLVAERRTGVSALHRAATGFVSAAAQSKASSALLELFTDDERAAFVRGRNAKPHTVPKHAELTDYSRATGFEAVIGWLWLRGERDRAGELMAAAWDALSR